MGLSLVPETAPWAMGFIDCFVDVHCEGKIKFGFYLNATKEFLLSKTSAKRRMPIGLSRRAS
jgi:hypothetical protein